ncbi:MAG TPA: hypothetical protein VNK26_06670 [Pyrinomonadaceae bacterium]|nr:hypothetical protein [Pyrinomonadaceae bacterium]
MLTGFLTGIGKWNRCGDARFGDGQERKAAVRNARSRSRKAC